MKYNVSVSRKLDCMVLPALSSVDVLRQTLAPTRAPCSASDLAEDSVRLASEASMTAGLLEQESLRLANKDLLFPNSPRRGSKQVAARTDLTRMVLCVLEALNAHEPVSLSDLRSLLITLVGASCALPSLT